LSGSFTVVDNSGMKSRTGGLSVSLAGPDGRVIGGGVAGLLTAAGPIQVCYFLDYFYIQDFACKDRFVYQMSVLMKVIP